MIKKLLAFVLFASSATLTFVGCSPQTENVDTINDQGKAVMQLDYRDFDRAASEMVQSMIASGAFKKEGGGRYVVAKGRIVNDTMQRIDTDQLMGKVEQEMTRSGLIVMTAAVGAGNAPKDSLVHSVREIRDSDKADEFNKDTLQAKGQLIAPELSISGKIIQRNVHYDNNKQQVEYYFQLQMNNLTNGLVFWQNENIIGKRGSDKKVPW
jgi:penicillin-binding protein activator